jgi:hypothetical protein
MAHRDEAKSISTPCIKRIFSTALQLGGRIEWMPGRPAVASRGDRSWEVDMEPVPRHEMERMLRSVLDDRQWVAFETVGVVDLTYSPIPDGPRLWIRVSNRDGQLQVDAETIPS